jgi:hypothetical protein
MAAKTAYFSLIMGATLLSGCATMPRPANPPLVEYQREQHLARAAGQTCATPAMPAIVAGRTRVEADVLVAMPDLIGPGDRLKLMISGDADVISGSYVVAANGQLVLQGIAAIDAAGRSLAAVEQAVRQALLAGGFIRDIAGNVKLAQPPRHAVRRCSVCFSTPCSALPLGLKPRIFINADFLQQILCHPGHGIDAKWLFKWPSKIRRGD